MVDHKKVEQAIRLLLEGIGEDPDREGLAETPDRIARMYEEICGGMNEDAAEHLKKTFTAENNEMVVEKDITFYSMCEHHMLPFYGKVHIAYIPDGKVVGLSKLARTVEVFARRLQLQEQMTAQIADALMENLHPKGVMVLAEAEHMCMTMRGIKKPGSKTVSVVTRGAFEENEKLQNMFFRMIGLRHRRRRGPQSRLAGTGPQGRAAQLPLPYVATRRYAPPFPGGGRRSGGNPQRRRVGGQRAEQNLQPHGGGCAATVHRLAANGTQPPGGNLR